jgi:hypothetical protein
VEVGIQTIEEAFAAAKLEELTGTAAPEGVGASPEAPPVEAPPTVGDQPSDTDPDAQALVDSLLEQPTEGGEIPAIEDPAFWAQQTEVQGELVTFGEMKNGYMRRKDYTQKTQAVSEERRSLEEAAKFYESFNADPSEFARAMAVEYGWVDPDTTAPVMEVEIPQVLSSEELDARLEEMLAERVSADPRVVEAEEVQARRLIDEEFDRIGQDMKVQIPRELRESLLAEAAQRQVFDLELLFKARLAGVQHKSDNLIRGGGQRPRQAGGLGAGNEVAAPAPTTVEEAWAQAKAEAAAAPR